MMALLAFQAQQSHMVVVVVAEDCIPSLLPLILPHQHLLQLVELRQLRAAEPAVDQDGEKARQ